MYVYSPFSVEGPSYCILLSASVVSACFRMKFNVSFFGTKVFLVKIITELVSK